MRTKRVIKMMRTNKQIIKCKQYSKQKKRDKNIILVIKDSMKQNDIDIAAIMRQFDQYVQVSLQNKSSQQEPQQDRNQLDQYYHNMQKRLKIKAVSQDQKFENMLGPMKNLKSFVSIKEFLRGLNQKPLKTQTQPTMSQNTKRKLQYEDLRGGLYMEKVQNHLKRNNMKRKLDSQAQFLLKQLEENQTQKNQYRTWMENVLGKINMKEESFLKPIQKVQTTSQDKHMSKEFILTQITNNTDIKKVKRQNLKRRMSQEKEQKNFKKVSNFLAERLRKILTDKYVNNSAKQSKKNKEMMKEYNYDDCFKMVTQPSVNAVTCRKTLCRTSATSKRIRQSIQNGGGVSMRAQTTDLRNRKAPEEIWKHKLHTKMDNFMSVTNTYYQKCQQEKKQYKKLTNPYSDLVKDENEN